MWTEGRMDGRTRRRQKSLFQILRKRLNITQQCRQFVIQLTVIFLLRPATLPAMTSAAHYHKNVGGPTVLLNDGDYTPTKCHIPEEPYLQLHHCQVLKSLKSEYVYFSAINFFYQVLYILNPFNFNAHSTAVSNTTR